MKMASKAIYTCSVFFVLVFNLFHWVQGEVFTAIADVEPLLQTHQRIIEDVYDYIAKEETKITTLKKRLNIYEEEHKKAMEDIPNYLGNPINAFTLIKRLTTDLDLLRKIVTGTENMKNITTNHEDMKYPGSEDITGAAQALTRLQDVYKLNIHELSEGILNGVVYSTPMTAGDCYELGLALYNDGDYKNALLWLTEAKRKYQNESELHHFSENEIVEFISASHFYLGDIETALELTKQVLMADPKHPLAPSNIILYQKALAEKEAKDIIKQISGEQDAETTESPILDEDYEQYEKERKAYEFLCRGEYNVAPVIAKRLYCRYLTENHPFLKLAPIKMEYMYFQPDIVIFHEVMSDAEIQFIQEAAKQRFGRALVHDAVTGEMVPVKYRISKSAWLSNEESPIIARVSQRVADMTGLTMETAEDLQVVNYGIGGHYEPHFDFSRKHESGLDFKNAGNRIGTLLFYMTDVAQGGATVFTSLGLSLFPIKGAAAFWFNLHPSGEGDLATRHAACPVLRGSKWVSNKWMHLGGHEFLRPCNLEYQPEGIARKIPKPVRKSLR